MTPEFAIEVLKNLMFQTLLLATPFLLGAMAVGLLVSLFQAVTTIHEQSLTFVPKLLIVALLLLLLLPWVVRTLVEFMIAVVEKMPQMVQ